ncbi:Cna protein B-type domain-containing protein [Amphibacillus marinus]|uniref:Cna protein B-type domain-containing protein n=1 Tax=Amphibacillus marinus TaxID=872970 RepID=A0A1H8KFW9_9BACI|nr:SpaA isopeptide-forming pilin-related protein [Amphibacillus marinus]SEN91318.1 Cna protein B-type domain-containing protein [Amphibacillus marinus]
MKRIFPILLIFTIIFSQVSSPFIIIANSTQSGRLLHLAIDEGSNNELAIVTIETASEVDQVSISLPEATSYDPETTEELNDDRYQWNYVEERHEILLLSINSSLPFNLALTDLADGEHNIEASAFSEESELANETFTFEIEMGEDVDAREQTQESEDSEKDEVADEEEQADAEVSNSEADQEEEAQLNDEEETDADREEPSPQEDLIFVPMVGNLNVDIDLSPRLDNVLAGNDAVYRLVLKLTGARSAYTGVTIAVDLPISDHVTFDPAANDLAIAGVEPAFDAENNQLIYQFDTLASGQTYDKLIRLSTENGLIPNGTTLVATATFSANEQAALTDDATINIEASTSIVASKNYLRAEGNPRNIAVPNSRTVWSIRVNIPKSNIGQGYLEEGSQITIVDNIPQGLTYHSTASGPEPDITGNQLSWTFDVPSYEEQVLSGDSLFETEIEVLLTVASNTTDQTLTNTITANAVFVGAHEEETDASDSVTIVNSNLATGDISGTVFVPAHLGPSNDSGGIGNADNRDPNPIVYDDAYLRFYHHISPLHHSIAGDYREYITWYNIDNNLNLDKLNIGGTPRYRPTADFPVGIPLVRTPSFNIEAFINGSRVILVENAEINQDYNRGDLGLADDDFVSIVYINFTDAPSGMSGLHVNYYFNVEQGYTGTVTNEFDVYGETANGNFFGRNSGGNYYGQDPLAGPRSATIAPRPTDQPPIATVGVELLDHTGGYVTAGPNRARVNLSTQSSSTLSMTGSLESVVLLPPGIRLADVTNDAFIDADGRSTADSATAMGGNHEILDESFNGSGRQLVKFSWNDRLLRPGNSVFAEIDVEIDESAPGALTFDVYGFSGDQELAVPSVSNPGVTDTVLQTDSNDLNQDGSTADPRLRSGNVYSISGQYDIQTEKLVRGQLDDDFSQFGRTVPSGSIDYRLILTNMTGRDISYMTLIDVMPSEGDFGITDNAERGSQFTPVLTGPIQVPSEWAGLVDIYYSEAQNPERDDLIRNTDYPETTTQLTNPADAEAPNWTLEAGVANWSAIHSFKVELSEGTEWIAGEDIIIDFTMQAPLWSDVTPDVLDPDIEPSARAAWNSFAIATDNGQPVEPLRVGVFMEYDNAVELTKGNEDGETLAGAVFDLVDAQGDLVSTDLTTDENGVIRVENLQPGSYAFIETEALPGYQLDPTPVEFEIEFAQQALVEVTKVNIFAPGAVELLKLGEEGEALEGGVFTLVDADGDELETGLTTDVAGRLLVEGLLPGSYAFIETQAPFGHDLDPTPILFEIVFNQQETLQLEVDNEQSTGAVQLVKVNENGTVLEGVIFELQDADGTILQVDLTTDEDGLLVVDNLKPGQYQFVETATLPGYDLISTPLLFEIELGQAETLEVEFENSFTPGAVQLTKLGEDGEPLAGAVFTLVDVDENELETGLATDEDGVLLIEGLAPGFYAFIETEAPFGHDLNPTPLVFEIVFDQQSTLAIEVENEQTPGAVELTKEGEDGALLAGVEFELQDGDGNSLQTDLVTDEDGLLFIDELKPGLYQLVETATIPGYELDPTPIEFEIELGQTTVTAVSFVNPLATGSVQLFKLGEGGEHLEGAVFSLIDENEVVIATGLTTDENGILVVDDLKPGLYAFIETEAPFGFELDATPIPFEIIFNQQDIVELEIENIYTPSAFELTKEGPGGERLAGVVFTLQDEDGNTLDEGLVTDEDGLLFIDDLIPGRYQLIETETIPGYDLDPTPIEFEIGLGQTTVTEVTFVNPLTPGSVQLSKVGELGEALVGAVFSLINDQDEVIATGLTTDQAGFIQVDDLLPGNYAFVEIEAPFGHDLDETPIPFEIVFNQQAVLELEIENEQTPGAVQLLKEGEDGELLEGVTFELQDSDGNSLQTDLLTDEAGILFIDELKPGSYQLVETATIPGYEFDPTPLAFEIELGQVATVELTFVNELTPGGFRLLKLGEGGELLEGAVFNLLAGDGELLLPNLVTDPDGLLTVEGLRPGSYQLIETEAPFGFQLDPTPIAFEIVFNQQELLELEMENLYIPSAFQLTKEGEDGELLAGVVFALQDRDGNTLQADLITGEDGILLIDNLIPGAYQLVETATIPGYDLDPTPIAFEIGLGETEVTEVTFVNPLTPGDVELVKISETGEALAGAVFTLINEAEEELATGLTTDENGVIVVTDLLPGQYAFVETEAPFGHDLLLAPIAFEIVFNQQTTLSLEVENEQSTGSVQLLKEGEDGALLTGVTFELQDQAGNTLIEDLVTDEDGLLVINELKPGQYQLVETASIPGYQLDSTPLAFEIVLGPIETVELSMTNALSLGAVQLLKVGEGGEALANAVFTLLDADGQELATELTTNADGIVLIEDLLPGEYAFVETAAPFGYQLDQTPIGFEIVFNQQEILEIEVENLYIPSAFELTKEGEYGERLAGVEFELQDAGGNSLETGLVTNEEGQLLIDNLNPGSYQLIETQALPGYQLDPTPISFEIGLGQTTVTEVTFVNELTPGAVQLTKQSSAGEFLSGAVFTLLDGDGAELETELTTDEGGLLVVEDLAPGSYALVETAAPFGYVLDEAPIEFEIEQNQQAIVELVFENTPILSELLIIKVDSETDATLAGAEFELINEAGDIVTSVVTDENGQAVIDGLPVGDYQLVETAAPEGYQLLDEPIEITIVFGHFELEYIVENSPEQPEQPPVLEEDQIVPPVLPQTGEEWLRYLMTLGTMLFTTGGILVLAHLKKMKGLNGRLQ